MAEAQDMTNLVDQKGAIVNVIVGIDQRWAEYNRRGVAGHRDCPSHRDILIHGDYDMDRAAGREWLPITIPTFEPDGGAVPGGESLLNEVWPRHAERGKSAWHCWPNPIAEDHRLGQNPHLQFASWWDAISIGRNRAWDHQQDR